MFPIESFEKKFREILGELDALDGGEELDELNAEFEDALFMFGTIDESEEDWQEELDDALTEFESLCEDYRALDVPGIQEIANRFDMAVKMALGALA